MYSEKTQINIVKCIPNDSPILRGCDNDPCGQGGYCKITPAGYKCICEAGYEYKAWVSSLFVFNINGRIGK